MGSRARIDVVDQMDVRPGGSWRFVIDNSDGVETAVPPAYRENHGAGADRAQVRVGGPAGPRGVETTTFDDLVDRSKVSTTSLFDTTEERDGLLISGMERATNETYARLDELLASVAAR